jgi:hypothetical protein
MSKKVVKREMRTVHHRLIHDIFWNVMGVEEDMPKVSAIIKQEDDVDATVFMDSVAKRLVRELGHKITELKIVREGENNE